MGNLGRLFAGAVLSVFLLGSVAHGDPVLYLSPPSNGYSQVFAMGLSITYSNIGGNIGQLKVSNPNTVGVLEQGDPAASGGVGISSLSFSLTADFNLSTGLLLSSDANLSVNGSITSVPTDLTAFLHTGANNFYQSGAVGRYGDLVTSLGGGVTGPQIINFTFLNNTGQIWPGQLVYVILNTGNVTPAGGLLPSSTALLDGYTSGISTTATAGSPQLLWSATSATADVFVPLPRAVWAGFVLLGLCGATRVRRRSARI